MRKHTYQIHYWINENVLAWNGNINHVSNMINIHISVQGVIEFVGFNNFNVIKEHQKIHVVHQKIPRQNHLAGQS